MKLHPHDEEGPPCKHMEALLQQAADGSSKGLKRWYAIAHAARCGRCGRFLVRLEETVLRLRKAKRTEPTEEVVARLSKGVWRNDESGS